MITYNFSVLKYSLKKIFDMILVFKHSKCLLIVTVIIFINKSELNILYLIHKNILDVIFLNT